MKNDKPIGMCLCIYVYMFFLFHVTLTLNLCQVLKFICRCILEATLFILDLLAGRTLEEVSGDLVTRSCPLYPTFSSVSVYVTVESNLRNNRSQHTNGIEVVACIQPTRYVVHTCSLKASLPTKFPEFHIFVIGQSFPDSI